MICRHDSNISLTEALSGPWSRGLPQRAPRLLTPDGLHEQLDWGGLLPYNGQLPLASLQWDGPIIVELSFYQTIQ